MIGPLYKLTAGNLPQPGTFVNSMKMPRVPVKTSDFGRLRNRLLLKYDPHHGRGATGHDPRHKVLFGPAWIDPGCSVGAYNGWVINDYNTHVSLRFGLRGNFLNATQIVKPSKPRRRRSFLRRLWPWKPSS